MGVTGATGQSVSFSTPTCITLASGSQSTVTDVITILNNVQNHQLTFGLVKGDKGDDGDSNVGLAIL